MLGGTEKLRGGVPDYGVPLWNKLADALVEVDVDVVVDLSDEPVVGPRRRFRLASRRSRTGFPTWAPTSGSIRSGSRPTDSRRSP